MRLAPSLCRALGILLLAGLCVARSWGDDPFALVSPAELSQETRTDFKFELKAKAGEPPFKFAIKQVRKNGTTLPTPNDMKLDAASGWFTWQPSEAEAGKYEIDVTVKDAKDREATATVRITVKERAITAMNGAVADLLKKWYAEGTAAGNTGDVYDNRDRDHSPLNIKAYPQLDHIVYTREQLDKRVDWAAQHTILPYITFGNSSTSAPVTHGGSNIRLYYVHPRGTPFLYEQYRKNNIYMYPGHHDHHPGRNGKPFYGDVYPANTPYLIGSQGSSGSDQPFMRVVPLTLAAFRPDVKKKLAEAGLLMPTVQMIFRSSNSHLKSPEEYLTGKAHPTIFEGSWVNDLAMVKKAHELTLETLPPMVQLKVVEEDEAVDGKDYFDAGKSEKLFDTPAAIARIYRTKAATRRMVVSAEESFDVNKKPLTYTWVVLRGDAKKIKINKKNEAGSLVELIVPPPVRRVIPDSPHKIESNRIDIGVFVHNGANYSAPGFVTVFGLDSEARHYDSAGRVLEMGYGVGEANLNVSDWTAFLRAMTDDAGAWPLAELREAFIAVGGAELRGLGGRHDQLADRLALATERQQAAAKRKEKATNSLHSAEQALVPVQRTYARVPTPENEAAFKAATMDVKFHEEQRRQADAEAAQVQKALEEARREHEAFLTKPKDVAARALARLRDDTNFYPSHREKIESLVAADAGRQARYQAICKRYQNFGILPPAGTAVERAKEQLSAYQTGLRQRFHSELFADILFPKLLSYHFQAHFVDQRVAARKEWRDVYHYDSASKLSGWTRYAPDGHKEFTATGLLIVEKDEQGRIRKARAVKYAVDFLDRNAAIHTVKMTPGDKQVIFEYAADGKVTEREEKVDEKK
jgi:hypothetical protein